MENRPRHPSQAEGDRASVGADLGEQGNVEQPADEAETGRGFIADPGRPSQAEGSRETVEEDLNEKFSG